MSNKTYNILKYLSSIALPALATFLIAFGKIWDISIMNPIAATVTALAAFLGSLICISSKKYFEDKEIVDSTSGIYSDGGEVDE